MVVSVYWNIICGSSSRLWWPSVAVNVTSVCGCAGAFDVLVADRSGTFVVFVATLSSREWRNNLRTAPVSKKVDCCRHVNKLLTNNTSIDETGLFLKVQDTPDVSRWHVTPVCRPRWSVFVVRLKFQKRHLTFKKYWWIVLVYMKRNCFWTMEQIRQFKKPRTTSRWPHLMYLSFGDVSK